MREIKFRAWDKFKGEMFDPMPIVDFTVHKINAVHLMQYTGFKDKNGREIYEGDLVKYRYERDTSGKDIVEFTERVEWGETLDMVGFCIHQQMDCEVIGNIYENPELMK